MLYMSHPLRSAVIRLAHQQIEMRPHLLPLLRQADSAEYTLDHDIMGPKDYYGVKVKGRAHYVGKVQPDPDGKGWMARSYFFNGHPSVSSSGNNYGFSTIEAAADWIWSQSPYFRH